MNVSRAITQKLFMGIIAAIGWFALILQFYILVHGVPGNGLTTPEAVANFFSYFTVLTNFLVAASLTIPLLAPRSRAGLFFLRPSTQTAVALYILAVGIVYSLLLRKVWDPQGLQLVADRLLHDVVPLLYGLFWLIVVPRTRMAWTLVFAWLLYPLCYLSYALLRGLLTGWYAYPFLHIPAAGVAVVLTNILVISCGFTGLGLLLIALKRPRVKINLLNEPGRAG